MSDETTAIINFIIGVVLCVLVLISYIPQHIECIQLQSTKGLSLYTILLATISCSTSTIASLLHDWDTICYSISSNYHYHDHDRHTNHNIMYIIIILNACMPTIQNIITIVIGTPTYVIYYFHYYTNSQTSDTTEVQQPISYSKYRWDVTITTITWLFVSSILSCSIYILVIYGSIHSITNTVTICCGMISAITNTIQWIPQINTTLYEHHEGVLSITSLFISVMTDSIIILFWIYGPTNETLWIYLSLTTDAILQMILIGIVLYFRYQRRRQQRHNAESIYLEDDNMVSTVPLLSPSHTETGSVVDN